MAPERQPLCRPHIRIVDGADDRARVYRFWYDTYVTEMRRPVKNPDHERRLLVDELEDHSMILAAHAGGAVVGTVRLNVPSRGPTAYYEALYQLAPSVDERARLAIVTKYMVDRRYRAGALPYELACAALVECAAQGIATAYMDCNDHLLDYFTALGFETAAPSQVHPEYGRVNIMKYDLSEPERMRGLLGRVVRSSVAAAARRRQAFHVHD